MLNGSVLVDGGIIANDPGMYAYLHSKDNLGKKNIAVSTETKKDLFDKYKPYIDAIVRSIKIVNPQSSDKKGP